eukprot:2637867-Prymnesium_polylepis.1
MCVAVCVGIWAMAYGQRKSAKVVSHRGMWQCPMRLDIRRGAPRLAGQRRRGGPGVGDPARPHSRAGSVVG